MVAADLLQLVAAIRARLRHVGGVARTGPLASPGDAELISCAGLNDGHVASVFTLQEWGPVVADWVTAARTRGHSAGSVTVVTPVSRQTIAAVRAALARVGAFLVRIGRRRVREARDVTRQGEQMLSHIVLHCGTGSVSPD